MLSSFLVDAKPYIEEYGYWAVAVAIFLEDFGLPLPGETILLAGAALASQGYLSMGALLAVSWLSATAGDNTGYLIGRFGGRRLIVRYGHYVLITRPRLQRVEEFVQRYGAAVVIVARFVSLLRQLNGIVAGISLMPWWRFLLCNAFGSALWVGTWGLFSLLLGSISASVLIDYSVISATAVILIFAVMFISHRRSRR
jgi:membrane protein DedA with SNARE-associated domain